MGETKKHQRQEGTPLDNGPNDPLMGGEPVAGPQRGPRQSARGGHRGRRGRPLRWGRTGDDRGGGRWGLSALDG